MAIDITRCAKTKKANYCLKTLTCEQRFLSGMAFNIDKAVRVQRETSVRRVQKQGMSTQKYNFKKAKIQRKTPRHSSKF